MSVSAPAWSASGFPAQRATATVVLAGDDAHEAPVVESSSVPNSAISTIAAEAAGMAETMLDLLPVGVLLTDACGVIERANLCAERAFGYGRGEMIGERLNRLISDPGTAHTATGHGPDGRTFSIEMTVSHFVAKGTPMLAYLVRETSAEIHRAREQEKFLANVAHELRTPVTTLIVSADVLAEALPPEASNTLRRLTANIAIEARRLTTLLDDLLYLHSAQDGGAGVRAARCDLRDVVRGASDAIGPVASQRGQQLCLEVPERPVWAIADGQVLIRALLNLLVNASKYGPDGSTIRIGVAVHADEAVFSVADRGPGIAAADRERIFQRFFRASTAGRRRIQGNGLGLPICRAAAEMHGGRAWVEAAPQQGSIFKLAVPLRGTQRLATRVART